MTSHPQVDRPDLDALFADLAHPNPNIQREAYLAMVDYWPEQSMPRLLALLGQSDVSVYRAAVKGLGAFGAKALQPLADLFTSSPDGTVRACCVKAYAQIASNFPEEEFSPEAMTVLETALSDESPVVSQSAVMALGQVGIQALPLLIRICKGDNIAHVQSAAMALAEIADPQAEACLREVLDDPSTDPLARQMVEASLGRLESRR
ncbi:HEAT repeat domain-containing protein [Synechococcus sp. CS-197]|uniref:HEAT repeat domain-containing protein n=1 Tax=Synechococcus sp. CS-197 TaxID=2847985 RepID=UPI0001525199|nr:HEAT repeat domain-containing protein [Synechococcus sp. CS-197]MCT0250074.1 HEAT repeat domain-containing protein [Synechococcus sp. CS-197]CAK22914.1 Bilin biosynthesis protein CpeZ [Synechococcus sp. WH 7803]